MENLTPIAPQLVSQTILGFATPEAQRNWHVRSIGAFKAQSQRDRAQGAKEHADKVDQLVDAHEKALAALLSKLNTEFHLHRQNSLAGEFLEMDDDGPADDQPEPGEGNPFLGMPLGE